MHEKLLAFYKERLRIYGTDSAQALAWREEKSQLLRFQILSEIADLSGASVLDEGCGLGDLYPFVASNFSSIAYTGVDINPDLIAAAKQKYPDAAFEVVDFSSYSSDQFDYVFASGTFTFRIANYKQVYFEHIRKMFALAKVGIAFNMLDELTFPEGQLMVTYSASEVGDFCRTLTDKVVFRNDYSPEDFTFYLYQ